MRIKLFAIMAIVLWVSGCASTPKTLSPETKANIQSYTAMVKVDQDKVLAADPGQIGAPVGGNPGASIATSLIVNVATKGIAANAVKKYNEALQGYDFRSALRHELERAQQAHPNPKLTSAILVNTAPTDSSDAQIYFEVDYALNDGLLKKSISARIQQRVFSSLPALRPKNFKGDGAAQIMVPPEGHVQVDNLTVENVQVKMDELAALVAAKIIHEIDALSR